MKKLCASIALCAFLILSGCSDKNPALSGSSLTTTTPSLSTSTADSTATVPPDTTSSDFIFTTDPTQSTQSTPPTQTTPPPVETISLPEGSLELPVLPPSLDLSGKDIAAVDAWFSDAVFVGDSLSLGWRNYVTQQRAKDPGFMGQAQFLVSGSLSATNSLWPLDSESPHVTYAGEKMFVWDAIAQTGAKKVFIMFGANEPYWISLNGMDKVLESFQTLISNIKSKSPNAEIYLISSTYFVSSYASTSSALRSLNLRLIDLCVQNRYGFINLADLLSDGNGSLRESYCSDGKCHLTSSAYAVWASAMRGYAAPRVQ